MKCEYGRKNCKATWHSNRDTTNFCPLVALGDCSRTFLRVLAFFSSDFLEILCDHRPRSSKSSNFGKQIISDLFFVLSGNSFENILDVILSLNKSTAYLYASLRFVKFCLKAIRNAPTLKILLLDYQSFSCYLHRLSLR